MKRIIRQQGVCLFCLFGRGWGWGMDLLVLIWIILVLVYSKRSTQEVRSIENNNVCMKVICGGNKGRYDM